ncbi:lipopolysaccharide biosynthesis protein [Amphritea japonica]|uniref:Polysaccharide biosynthesis protein n=1 Tax=Amphritea japonica ATCC BAA-1530 TaxID=1278309 RepID=A0A7R6PIT6_9GAMM|nr:hypothetical protein [Amphritea japonica]BBB25220.1 polysaccharide biosynthesis protein [Amphritea japonica ATCC BAA-1530]
MKNNTRDFWVILIGKAAQVLLMLLSLKLSTYYLDPSVMGQIYLLTTIYTFFVFLLISPVGQFFNRYTHKWYGENVLYDRLWLYLLYIIVVCIIASIGAVVIHNLSESANISVVSFSLLVGGLVLIVSINQTVVPLFNMLNYRILFTTMTFFTSFLALCFSLVVIYYVDKSASSWLLGILIGNAVIIVFAVYIMRSILSANEVVNNSLISLCVFDQQKINKIIRFSVPVSLATVFMWAQNSGYRISIEKLIGLEYLGFLGVGLVLATQIFSVVESILMQYYHPGFYRSIKSESTELRLAAVNSYLNSTIPVYFSLALFLTFSIEYIFPILVSGDYAKGYAFCVFGVWIEFFRTVTNSISSIAHSEVKMKGYMYPYIFGALATNALVYMAALYVNDINSIPMALNVGALITMLLMYFNMRKILPFTINFTLVMIFLIAVLPSLLFFLLFPFPQNIDVYYISSLCTGGVLFLIGLSMSVKLGKKANG